MTATSQPAAGSRTPWVAIVGIGALALLGLCLLGYALYSLLGPAARNNPAATQVSNVFPTAAFIIPTTTPAPTAEPATAVPPTTTVDPAAVPTAAPSGPVLTIMQAANIRSGPGFNYPVIGGLEAGQTTSVVGRDASGQWYVIPYAAARTGQGWVSILISNYGGDTSALAVIVAPPTPAYSPTPVPPTAAPTKAGGGGGSLTGAHGITGSLNTCDGRTTFDTHSGVCVTEKTVNNSGSVVKYSVLGISYSGPQSGFQTSWGGDFTFQVMNSGCTGPTDGCNGPWNDVVRIYTAGTYVLSLQACFSDITTCNAGNGWEKLSQDLTVIINDSYVPVGGGGYSSHGIRGDAFSVENTTAKTGVQVWFNFKVTNTTGSNVNYGALAAHTNVAGATAKSWTNHFLDPNEVLEWRDNITFSTPGVYYLYLGICYSDKDVCLANPSIWERLSGDVAVTISQ